MILKPTVGQKQMPLPVNWQDSAWDLEVKVGRKLNQLNRSNELNRLNEERCLKLWRCGVSRARGLSCIAIPLTPTLSLRRRRLEGDGWFSAAECENGSRTGMSALR